MQANLKVSAEEMYSTVESWFSSLLEPSVIPWDAPAELTVGFTVSFYEDPADIGTRKSKKIIAIEHNFLEIKTKTEAVVSPQDYFDFINGNDDVLSFSNAKNMQVGALRYNAATKHATILYCNYEEINESVIKDKLWARREELEQPFKQIRDKFFDKDETNIKSKFININKELINLTKEVLLRNQKGSSSFPLLIAGLLGLSFLTTSKKKPVVTKKQVVKEVVEPEKENVILNAENIARS